MLTLNSIFRTIQGEGLLSGIPMVFIRTAGCSIGCKLCDTDYSRKTKLETEQIVDRVKQLQTAGWVWITGGEPTDQFSGVHDLRVALQTEGYKVAIATAGTRQLLPGWDFVSVSPHSTDLQQREGDQANIVLNLNGLQSIDGMDLSQFGVKYITPCGNLQECIEFVLKNPGWRLGIQAHKVWEVE